MSLSIMKNLTELMRELFNAISLQNHVIGLFREIYYRIIVLSDRGQVELSYLT